MYLKGVVKWVGGYADRLRQDPEFESSTKYFKKVKFLTTWLSLSYPADVVYMLSHSAMCLPCAHSKSND